ncbi:MAG: MbtH family NRPS accessory protein, partial [Streptosporangiaceae bacterium]
MDAFTAVVNDLGQHSLWPASQDPPPGWRRTFGPASRATVLAAIAQDWPDITPDSVRGGIA